MDDRLHAGRGMRRQFGPDIDRHPTLRADVVDPVTVARANFEARRFGRYVRREMPRDGLPDDAAGRVGCEMRGVIVHPTCHEAGRFLRISMPVNGLLWRAPWPR